MRSSQWSWNSFTFDFTCRPAAHFDSRRYTFGFRFRSCHQLQSDSQLEATCSSFTAKSRTSQYWLPVNHKSTVKSTDRAASASSDLRAQAKSHFEWKMDPVTFKQPFDQIAHDESHQCSSRSDGSWNKSTSACAHHVMPEKLARHAQHYQKILMMCLWPQMSNV